MKDLFLNTQVAFARLSNFQLRRAFILFKSLQIPFLFKTVKFFVGFGLRFRLPVEWIVKPTVFKHFIGGTSLQKCIPIATALARFNVKAILDYSSEDGNSVEVIEKTLFETLDSIEVASNHQNVVFAVFKPTAFCSEYVLEEMSSGKQITDSILQEAGKFRERVNLLCKTAYEKNVPIMIDAEDYAFQNFIDEVAGEMMIKYNKQKAVVYNTLQMYRHDRLDFLRRCLEDAKTNGYYLGIKLVRGAYMEKERARAVKLSYPSPIWSDKQLTDDAFDKAQEYCIHNIEHISLFSGTHNERSNAYLMELLDSYKLSYNHPSVYFSQLYGMSDHITFNLAQNGYNVAKYIPYGPVRKVLPYLIRRADENSSMAGQSYRELNLIRMELKRRKLKKL
jgi:proline dehydrogenase